MGNDGATNATITTYAVYECERNGNNVTKESQLVSVENVAREDPAMTETRLKNEAKRLADIQDGCKLQYLTAIDSLPLVKETAQPQRSSIWQPELPTSAKTNLFSVVYDPLDFHGKVIMRIVPDGKYNPQDNKKDGKDGKTGDVQPAQSKPASGVKNLNCNFDHPLGFRCDGKRPK